MTTLLPMWSAAVAIFWIGLALDRKRTWRRRQVLERDSEDGPAPTGRASRGSLAVIVPARDETQTLPQTLPPLLAQLEPGDRLLLVDDGSSDGTAALARELGATSGGRGRLTVLEAGPKPVGWAGKVAAQQAAWREISDGEMPDWVLLTDADILHQGASLERLLAKARRGGYDMVSVMVRLRTGSFWERLLIPAFVYFFQLLYPFPEVSKRSSPVAAAAGGCVLVRARALQALDGFAAIHDAVIDDVSLAKALKAARKHCWLGFDPGIASIRPYVSLQVIWTMVARSAFVQLGYHYWLVAAVVLGLLLFVAAPPFLLAAELLPAPAAGRAIVLLAAGLAWLLQGVLLAPFVRYLRAPLRYSLALPLAAIFYAAMTASSAWNHWRGRGNEWKGRAEPTA